MILWDMREGSVEKLYLNNNELLHGVIFGMCFILTTGLWSVPMAMITALLWSLSGAEHHDKYWRRWVMPSVVCVATALCSWSLLPLISIPLMGAVLSLGYGIITFDPNLPDTITDEGSWLGRFWARFFRLEREQELAVRCTIYLLLLLASIPCLI